jgi:hypothetical protein
MPGCSDGSDRRFDSGPRPNVRESNPRMQVVLIHREERSGYPGHLLWRLIAPSLLLPLNGPAATTTDWKYCYSSYLIFRSCNKKYVDLLKNKIRALIFTLYRSGHLHQEL